jgi:TonB family protein
VTNSEFQVVFEEHKDAVYRFAWRLVRSVGFGLDQNAITALKRWRFRPGTKDGKAVDVTLNIEVRFNIY